MSKLLGLFGIVLALGLVFTGSAYAFDPQPCDTTGDKWACLKDDTGAWDHKDFSSTARFGQYNTPTNGGWELAIKDMNDAVGAQGHVAWGDGQPQDFAWTYDPTDGKVTLTVGSETIMWTYDSMKAFDYLAIIAKADGTHMTKVENIMVNGNAAPDIMAMTKYEGHQLFMTDAEQANGFTVTGQITLDWGAPITSSGAEIPGVQFFAMNTHDLPPSQGEVPEFGTVGAGLALLGAAGYIGYKKRKK